jgi:hypothetical protein
VELGGGSDHDPPTCSLLCSWDCRHATHAQVV